MTFHVYRFYGEGDELLYVGQSTRLPSRLSEHRRDKEWWVEVQRIELDRCESKLGACELERDLIRAHDPKYNKIHRSLSAAVEPEFEDVCPCCWAPSDYLWYRTPCYRLEHWFEGPPDLESAVDSWEQSGPTYVYCSYCGDACQPDEVDHLASEQVREWREQHEEKVPA